MHSNLEISLHQNEQKLSPLQKKFNRLLKKIDQQQHKLQQWQQAQQEIKQRAATHILPRYTELHQMLFKQVELLLDYKQNHKVPKTHLAKLDFLVRQLSHVLLQTDTLSESQYQYLQQIHNDYFPQGEEDAEVEADINELTEEQLKELKKEHVRMMFAQQFEIDPDELDFDFDPDDLEEISHKFEDFLRRKEFEAQRNFFSAFGEEAEQQWEKIAQQEERREKKKQEKIDAAKKLANKSLKSIYQSLTALVHPDREPDEQKKIEKTTLMQKITEAYEKNDLLSLLQMQIQLSQHQKHDLSKLAKDQLELYVINLEQQAEKIQQEIDDIIYSFDWSDIAPYRQNITLKDLDRKFSYDVQQISQKLVEAEEKLDIFSEPDSLKLYLRNVYIPKQFL